MTEIVLVAGAGGVGKTTLAAGIGVSAARSGRRTLVLTVDPARYEAGADAGSKPWLIANAIRDPVAEAAEAARAEEARRAALAARTPHDRFHLHKPAGADNVAKPITSLGASMNTPGQRRFETVEEVLARGAVAAVAAVGAPCCGSLVSHSSSPLILIVVTGR